MLWFYNPLPTLAVSSQLGLAVQGMHTAFPPFLMLLAGDYRMVRKCQGPLTSTLDPPQPLSSVVRDKHTHPKEHFVLFIENGNCITHLHNKGQESQGKGEAFPCSTHG